mgnify:CR=1 FL=1
MRRARRQRGRLFCGGNGVTGRAVGPAHDKGNNHNGIEVACKSHKHCGIFGNPGFWRYVAVADGEDCHVAEIKQIVNGLIARPQPGERTRLVEFNGQKHKIAAIANEQQTAHRSVNNLGCHHLRVGYLPEDFKHDAAEKTQIEHQGFFFQAIDKEQIQGAAHNEQRAEKQSKAHNARPEFKKHKGRKQLDWQIDCLRNATVDVVRKQDVQDKHAPQREHEQLKADSIKSGAHGS